MKRPKRHGFERGDHVTLSHDRSVRGRVALSAAGVVTVHIPSTGLALYVHHKDVRHAPPLPAETAPRTSITRRVARVASIAATLGILGSPGLVSGEPDYMNGVMLKPS